MDESAHTASSQPGPTGETGGVVLDNTPPGSHGKATIPSDMHIKVHSPFKVYYDGRATSISALNDTGPFDILPGHRNFMTLVSACELIIRDASGSEQKIKIARAVMHVKTNDVTVFLDV